MTPAITATLPAPTPISTGDTGNTTATPLAALFADFLPPDSVSADAAPDSLPALALTPAEEPATELPEDHPWPPEGLASLWLPAPEPALPALPEPALPAAPESALSAAPAPVSLGAGAMPDSAAPSLSTTTPTENAAPISSTPSPIQIPAGTDTAPPLPEAIIPESGDANPAATSKASVSMTDGQNTAAAPVLSVPAARHSLESESISISQQAQAPALEAHLPTAEPTPSGGEVLQNETPPAPSISALPPAAPRIPAPAPAQPTPTTAPFPAPELHADNFPDAVGTHIQWLAEHKIGHAHLQLTPQDMGPLEVRLKLEGDQLQAHFTSAEAEVRQALEHSLPRLRELLGEHGLNLGQADIDKRPSQQHTSPSPHTKTSASSTSGYSDEAPTPAPPVSHVQSTHLVDAYA